MLIYVPLQVSYGVEAVLMNGSRTINNKVTLFLLSLLPNRSESQTKRGRKERQDTLSRLAGTTLSQREIESGR